MRTIRQWLNTAGFDWDNGRVLYQEVIEDEDHNSFPGWADRDQVKAPVEIDRDHPILDVEFDTGYGSPDTPRFVAYSVNKIFFPSQYDGATGLEVIGRNPDVYLHQKIKLTPYPGG